MQVQQDFIVIDTEGGNELSEIAIIDRSGKLVYEAFTQGHPNNNEKKINIKPLKEIVNDFLEIAQSKLIVCHFVKHDEQILKNSFKKATVTWQPLNFKCTCELAKLYFPEFSSYSLANLSKYLNLKVNQKYFHGNQAHTAKYDAEFTYQLYLKIMERIAQTNLLDTLSDQPNPFGSSRVDTPFQDHVDFQEIYQNEFEILKSIINDIKRDKNHQSKGAIVIGEPGTGKTHLMMRLAKELLKNNRLLFIRQPNNADAVLYHTYSRILESCIEKVPDSNYTQLEHLLANSFVRLISTTRVMTLNRKDQEILSAVKNNNLSLYEVLGAEGTQKKREYWQHIERRTNEWWANEYGVAGYSAQIIKGIVKFCSYSDPKRKELVTRWLSANELSQEELDTIGLNNWNEEMSKEEFSLQAISVFSKLSLLDEPVIIVFDQLEALGLQHNRRILLSFGEAVKEIFTHVPNSLIILNLFPDRWEQFKEIFDGSIVDRVSQQIVRLQRPSNEKLKEILELKLEAIGVNLETLFNSSELEIIFKHNSIRSVLNSAADYYRYKVNGVPLSITSTPVSQQEDSKTVHQQLKTLKEDFSQLQSIVNKIAHVLELSSTKTDSEVSNQKNAQLAQEPPVKPPSKQSFIASSEETIVIRYLEEQRSILEQNYTKPTIITDSDDIGKLITIAEVFKTIRTLQVDFLQLGKKVLPEHILLRNEAQSLALGFLHVGSNSFTARIKNYNELVFSNKDIKFILLRDQRQSSITGKVGKEEIEKLNYTSNGSFIIMKREDRINFELIYRLITDIQNRDFEVNMAAALEVLISQLKDYWLIKVLFD
jgi:DNA polymerase III epsilon subunit-like protein